MGYFDSTRDDLTVALRWAETRLEQSRPEAKKLMAQLRRQIGKARAELEGTKPAAAIVKNEPNDLAGIQKGRPKGPRRMVEGFDAKTYADKVRGAWLARAAGCTLGSPVEQWPVERMERMAACAKMKFPPEHYWTMVATPEWKRYGISPFADYSQQGMKHVPVDDDLTYTLLGLLILEEYGPEFTTEDVGKAWLKYLPMACTAEHAALENLKAGMSWRQAAMKDNPYLEWIGADIRSDPWGWAAPGWPEKAAEMAWRDAYLSHRYTGIYGEMFFAAAQAAAFVVDDPLEACRVGLTEIPARSRLYKEVSWALGAAPRLKDWRKARAMVDERYPGMHPAHTINNAALTVFGLALGGGDVGRTISVTVAMGLDNDCTGATAGSIIGAITGTKGVAAKWWKPFRGKVRTYMKGQEWFTINDIVKRFARVAGAVCRQG